MEIGYAPDLRFVVGALFSKFGESRDFEGPGLGVCGMEVEAIEFGEGQTFESSHYFCGSDNVS